MCLWKGKACLFPRRPEWDYKKIAHLNDCVSGGDDVCGYLSADYPTGTGEDQPETWVWISQAQTRGP